MLSDTTDVILGDGRLMSSRANRTAAIMAAAMTSVDANRSVFRRSSISGSIARRISPISTRPFLIEPASEPIVTKACRERCLSAGNSGARHRADKLRRSRYPALFARAPECSPRTVCTAPCNRRSQPEAGSTLKQCRRMKGESIWPRVESANGYTQRLGMIGAGAQGLDQR